VPSVSAYKLGGGEEGSHLPPNGIATYLTGMHLMGAYPTGLYITGMHLMSVLLMSMLLMGVYLIGVHLIYESSLRAGDGWRQSVSQNKYTQPFALFGGSALALVWLSPTPTMAISEMPSDACGDLSKYMATCF
jgi:hypothetical protein